MLVVIFKPTHWFLGFEALALCYSHLALKHLHFIAISLWSEHLQFISLQLWVWKHEICIIPTMPWSTSYLCNFPLLWNICTLCRSNCALKTFAIHAISITLLHFVICFISSKSRPIFSENEAVVIHLNDTPSARKRYENSFLSRMLKIISWIEFFS